MLGLANCSVTVAGLLLWVGMAGAQSAHPAAVPTANSDLPADAATHAATEAAMAGALSDGAHMQLTPIRAASKDDSLRADMIVALLREAIAKYRDVGLAVADGFRVFAPDAPQRIYHFTNWENAVRAELSFDAARPTSLLYTKDPQGGFHLIGAMYTAPARSSTNDLNARVPLGIARWHIHTNLCLPRRLRDRSEWVRTRNGLPLFGPGSPIATEEECRAVDGRFRKRVFNWMVHANVFTEDVWGAHPH